jgi:hypothetical protein
LEEELELIELPFSAYADITLAGRDTATSTRIPKASTRSTLSGGLGHQVEERVEECILLLQPLFALCSKNSERLIEVAPPYPSHHLTISRPVANASVGFLGAFAPLGSPTFETVIEGLL